MSAKNSNEMDCSDRIDIQKTIAPDPPSSRHSVLGTARSTLPAQKD